MRNCPFGALRPCSWTGASACVETWTKSSSTSKDPCRPVPSTVSAPSSSARAPRKEPWRCVRIRAVIASLRPSRCDGFHTQAADQAPENWEEEIQLCRGTLEALISRRTKTRTEPSITTCEHERVNLHRPLLSVCLQAESLDKVDVKELCVVPLRRPDDPLRWKPVDRVHEHPDGSPSRDKTPSGQGAIERATSPCVRRQRSDRDDFEQPGGWRGRLCTNAYRGEPNQQDCSQHEVFERSERLERSERPERSISRAS